MFSVFETYTEWITKGKMNPSVELGKKLNITTDQWGLIVDYQIMDGQQDRDIVIEMADRILPEYKVASWSFDKGYWLKENKEILQLEVPQVIIPKLGKRNKQEEGEEHSRSFKKLKNKHSAIESNINELEHRGKICSKGQEDQPRIDSFEDKPTLTPPICRVLPYGE